MATQVEIIAQNGPTSSNVTSVASVAASSTVIDAVLMKANLARKGGAVYNDSTAILYLQLGSGGTTTSVYTVQIAPGAYYELPVCQGGVYRGDIRGVWASANGNARVTELV